MTPSTGKKNQIMWYLIKITDIDLNQMYVDNVQFDVIKPIEQATAYQVRDIFFTKRSTLLNLLYEELVALSNFLCGLNRIKGFTIGEMVGDQENAKEVFHTIFCFSDGKKVLKINMLELDDTAILSLPLTNI